MQLITYYKNLNLSYNVTDGGEGQLGCHNPKPSLCKKVYQYTLEGTFIKEFNSVAAAAESINVKPSVLSGCLTGKKSKSCKGYL